MTSAYVRELAKRYTRTAKFRLFDEQLAELRRRDDNPDIPRRRWETLCLIALDHVEPIVHAYAKGFDRSREPPQGHLQALTERIDRLAQKIAQSTHAPTRTRYVAERAAIEWAITGFRRQESCYAEGLYQAALLCDQVASRHVGTSGAADECAREIRALLDRVEPPSHKRTNDAAEARDDGTTGG